MLAYTAHTHLAPVFPVFLWRLYMTDNQPQNDALTLSQVLTMFHQKVSGFFIEKYNVTAEISEIKKHASMWVFTLVEQTNSTKRVTVSAKLFKDNYTKATAAFVELTGKELVAGMNVSMLVKLDYNKLYNKLDLIIESFDPNFSVGQLEIQRRLLCKELKELNLWDKNRSLTTPTDFFKIAVIAGKETQGYRDFIAAAQELNQLSLLRIKIFDSSMQGAKMESTICDALQQCEKFHKIHVIDAIVIIRGGGDSVNLDELNNRNIAISICNSSVPVFVGIGHENDKTILDEIANKSFGTPSKVIEFIKQAIATSSDAAYHDLQRLEHTFDLKLSAHEIKNREMVRQISSQAEQHLNLKVEAINNNLRKITVNAQSHIDRSTDELFSHVKNVKQALDRHISLLDNGINKHILAFRDNTDELIRKIEITNATRPARAICTKARTQALEAKKLALKHHSNPAVSYFAYIASVVLSAAIGLFIAGFQGAVVLTVVIALLSGVVLVKQQSKRKNRTEQIENAYLKLLHKIEFLESSIN